jgi:8-oxo-dGTP pyrophosphatase MutT (NUDIX family)
VLLLLYPKEDVPHIVLTVRSVALTHHRGQVSLPGGRIESGESAARAALREAREEIGVDPGPLSILGELTPFHVVVSRYIVHPVVAAATARPRLSVLSAEVERILEVSVHELLDPARARVEDRVLEGLDCEVPYFDVAGEKVWGATAMILSEFAALFGSLPDPWAPRSRPGAGDAP